MRLIGTMQGVAGVSSERGVSSLSRTFTSGRADHTVTVKSTSPASENHNKNGYVN